MTLSMGAVILAGGRGSRLLGVKAKPLAPLLGKKLIDYPLFQISELFKRNNIEGKVTVVTGYCKEEVEGHLKKEMDINNFAFQEKPLGTGDALKSYFKSGGISEKFDLTLVLCADVPLLDRSHLDKLYSEFSSGDYDCAVATFCTERPEGYGRIIRKGSEITIVEENEASTQEKKVKEVNSGVYLFKTSYVLEALSSLEPRGTKGEYYLTDVLRPEHKVKPVLFKNGDPFLGVNDLEQLEEVEKKLIKRKVSDLRKSGVRFLSSESVYIDYDVTVGEGSIIHPNVMLFGNTRIGKGCVIEAGSIIKNSIIEEGTVLKPYSHLDRAQVGSKAVVGPFANLRPGTETGKSVKIGNFVEIKKATLREGVKVSHLSYVGDAEVGDRTNIGCGFITCNYDGANKHFSRIGRDTFVGSDTQLIAPVEIGDECFVASGSTIGQSMPDGSFAISRSRQVTKEGMAKKFIRKNKED